MKTNSITGHLAMFQTSTAVEPIPSGLATALTTGPVSTSESASRVTSTIIAKVTSSCSGRSFQNGRPSGVS